MKNLLANLIVFFSVVSVFTYAQTTNSKLFVGKIIADSSSVIDDVREKMPVTSILKSENKIEIRLIGITSPEYTTVTVVSYNNEKWNSTYFSFNQKTNQFDKKPTTQIGLDKLVSKLVSNNIFSLPTDKKVAPTKQFFNLSNNEVVFESMSISHGITYYIEFKVGNNYRRYSYSSPAEFAKFYPHMAEYKNMTDIVKQFNLLLLKGK